MIYDFFMFLISCVLFIVIAPLFFKQDEEWKRNENLYWAQFVYGMLSFPFLIFAIPLCPSILTKARPTAYDQDGRCVPTYITTEAYLKKNGQKVNINVERPPEERPMIEVDDIEYVL